MENAIGAILAPGNDHHEHDDGLTEASGEEEKEDDEDLASLPELISSDEEDEEDEEEIFDGMVVTGVVVNLQSGGQGHLHLSRSRSLVNGALRQVVGIQVREEV